MFDFDPLRMRHPLRSESLKLFDSVMGREVQKRPDQMESFIVG